MCWIMPANEWSLCLWDVLPLFLNSYNIQLKPPLFLIPLLPLFPVRETSGNNGLKAKTPHKSVGFFFSLFACREDQRTTEIFRKAIKMWTEGGSILRWAGTVPVSLRCSRWACVFPSRNIPFLSARMVRWSLYVSNAHYYCLRQGFA